MFEELFKKLGLTEEQSSELLGAFQEAESGLKRKNEELLSKMSKTKENLTGYEAELERLRQFEENQKLSSAESSKQYEEAKRLLEERFQKELAQKEEDAKTWRERFEKKEIDANLSSQLTKLGVTNPAYKDLLVEKLRKEVSLNEQGVAMSNDLPLSDFVASYVNSEEGQNFVSAPVNNGAGTKQGATHSGSHSKKFSEMGSDEKMQLKKSNPALFEQIKSQG